MNWWSDWIFFCNSPTYWNRWRIWKPFVLALLHILHERCLYVVIVRMHKIVTLIVISALLALLRCGRLARLCLSMDVSRGWSPMVSTVFLIIVVALVTDTARSSSIHSKIGVRDFNHAWLRWHRSCLHVESTFTVSGVWDIKLVPNNDWAFNKVPVGLALHQRCVLSAFGTQSLLLLMLRKDITWALLGHRMPLYFVVYGKLSVRSLRNGLDIWFRIYSTPIDHWILLERCVHCLCYPIPSS